MLRGRLASIEVAATVRSAGLLDDGIPASANSVDILARRGLDLTDHRSRVMTRRELRASDLVLGMAREHVREAVVLAPDIWPRAFTLKELVRRGQAIGPRSSHQTPADWIAQAGAGRTTSELMGGSDEDDVADPYGLSLPNYERMIGELDDYLDRLIALLWAGHLQPSTRS